MYLGILLIQFLEVSLSALLIVPSLIILISSLMGVMIDIGCESQGLYYLKSNPPVVCATTESLNILHNPLGHSSLSKLQRMFPSFVKLESLVSFSL